MTGTAPDPLNSTINNGGIGRLTKRVLRKLLNSTSGKLLVGCAAALLLAQVAFLLNVRWLGMTLSLPVLVLFGWAALGHLVTLDDDMPGGWSNQEGSRKLWHASLLEFLVKALLLIATIMFLAFNL